MVDEEKSKKIEHPNCPQCGKPMRVIVPINMAICDACGEKYYIEKKDDHFEVLGGYYEVKAEKSKDDTSKTDELDWINTKNEDTHEPSHSEPEETKDAIEEKAIDISLPPVMKIEDNRISEFKQYVNKYVNKKFWVQVAKDELKQMVSELYDAGALGNNFNPSKVARQLVNVDNAIALPFYGVQWLDSAITKELITRVWLKLQGYKEIIKLEKLKYYIAIFHPEDMEDFLKRKLSDIKVKKYLYEMEAIDA